MRKLSLISLFRGIYTFYSVSDKEKVELLKNIIDYIDNPKYLKQVKKYVDNQVEIEQEKR